MIDYALAIGAGAEVLEWCKSVLEAHEKKHAVDISEREHIIDYLASDRAPARLRKMSYAQAKLAAEKWSTSQQKKGSGIVDTDEDIETIHDFLDGTKIVKLKTKKALQREGFFMAHCVGNYDPERSTIYSYRDKKNFPHATFEVSKSGEEIVQVKGKGNGPIHPKYIHPILAFLKAIGLNVRPFDMKNLGYAHVTKEAEAVLCQFVDKRGRGPNLLALFGEKYLAVG